ncbi:uncharacterized protein LOC128995379 isoform X2 [Macrosteles quadrilineatus]|uniref:uncharacterized protein LOC128995379 isoform X2 n=1 Tax=Macrosteles quadrilineatus TaxID=74068 RepID=UPI0023E1EB40|nr:uncharacterized protein LOC128995379 isoform X2 [Macrosteles quadrilineatus]
MKLVHHVLVVYVLALLQRETVAIDGEEAAHPETIKNDRQPGLGTWRAYAKGNAFWKVEVDEIRTQIQFHNRHEIYKGKNIVLLIYESGNSPIELKMKAAAEFARHKVRNGIVLILRKDIVHDDYIDRLDPMTKEIFAQDGANLYFEMENKIQIFDVVNKDDLEKRHETYRGGSIFTIYYEKDDDVRVGEYQQFQYGPLKEYVSFWNKLTGSLYTKSVFLKVQKESVLKGDTEFFQKICKGKGEPKQYPVVYMEADRKLRFITYLEEGWKLGPVLNDCARQNRNDPLQKPDKPKNG